MPRLTEAACIARRTSYCSHADVGACNTEALGKYLAIQLPVRCIEDNSPTHWLMQCHKSVYLNSVWLHLRANAKWTIQLTLADSRHVKCIQQRLSKRLRPPTAGCAPWPKSPHACNIPPAWSSTQPGKCCQEDLLLWSCRGHTASGPRNILHKTLKSAGTCLFVKIDRAGGPA